MRRRRQRPLALLVCSSGGHLAQLVALRDWWGSGERCWVTFDTPDAVSVLGDEQVIWAHHPTTRNVPNLIRNLGLAWRTIARLRPELVVSSGAGVALPFFVIGKLFGARTIYLEVFDRVDSPTLTGRLCYPLTDRFLLQWEEQRAVYPKGEVVGPLL